MNAAKLRYKDHEDSNIIPNDYITHCPRRVLTQINLNGSLLGITTPYTPLTIE